MNENIKILIETLEEYIKLLEDEISDNANFLYEHGVQVNENHVIKGHELRHKIRELKEIIDEQEKES
jgi:hypothetical protein